MPVRPIVTALAAGSMAMLWQGGPADAQNRAAALSGQVTSDAEGAMEGVVVSAKKPGSTVTVSVISDAQGRYSFPADRLPAGKYNITHPRRRL